MYENAIVPKANVTKLDLKLSDGKLFFKGTLFTIQYAQIGHYGLANSLSMVNSKRYLADLKFHLSVCK